jgi:Leucine-rich repeat (LRR) protein
MAQESVRPRQTAAPIPPDRLRAYVLDAVRTLEDEKQRKLAWQKEQERRKDEVRELEQALGIAEGTLAPVKNVFFKDDRIYSVRLEDMEELVDITPLRGLALEELHLRKTGVQDLSPLEGMPLRSLYIYESPVSDLGPVRACALEKVEVSCTRVSNLSPLEGKALRYLNASYSPIADVRLFRDIPFDQLLLPSTKVASLAPLAGKSYRVINLRGTPIKDLTTLEDIDCQELNVAATQISSLEPLRGKELETLDISGTAVSDLGPLEGMPLRELKLYRCRNIQDLRPLLTCRELENLLLPRSVTDVNYLKDHPSLKRIGYKHGLSDTAGFWKLRNQVP